MQIKIRLFMIHGLDIHMCTLWFMITGVVTVVHMFFKWKIYKKDLCT